jgi:enoyl-CoA hydratase
MTGTVLCTRDGAIATVTLSSPEKLNAVCLSMWQGLAAHMTQLSADDKIRVIILRGDGDQAFTSGGDIDEFLTLRDTVDRAMAYHEQVALALRAIAECRHPTLALIQGACIGGGLEIAGQCDLRICGASSRFGLPINKLGCSMYPREMEGLLHLVGKATVLEILLEGRILGANEAYEKGLVNRVVADANVVDEAWASARRICDGAPLVASWHKQWVRRLQYDVPPTNEELRDSFAFLDTADYRTGVQAFLSKKKPKFHGN